MAQNCPHPVRCEIEGCLGRCKAVTLGRRPIELPPIAASLDAGTRKRFGLRGALGRLFKREPAETSEPFIPARLEAPQARPVPPIGRTRPAVMQSPPGRPPAPPQPIKEPRRMSEHFAGFAPLPEPAAPEQPTSPNTVRPHKAVQIVPVTNGFILVIDGAPLAVAMDTDGLASLTRQWATGALG